MHPKAQARKASPMRRAASSVSRTSVEARSGKTNVPICAKPWESQPVVRTLRAAANGWSDEQVARAAIAATPWPDHGSTLQTRVTAALRLEFPLPLLALVCVCVLPQKGACGCDHTRRGRGSDTTPPKWGCMLGKQEVKWVVSARDRCKAARHTDVAQPATTNAGARCASRTTIGCEHGCGCDA